MKVRDIMHPPVTIDSKTKVTDALSEMSKRHIHSLIVVSNGKIAGLLTEDNILDNLNRISEKVADIMTKNIKTINDDEELSEAAEIMNREGIRRLPVMKKEKLVGIITATDLLAYAGELSEVFLID